MAAVDAALAVYEPTHGAKWTTEQWETHAQHLADHVAELGVPIITLQGAALEEHLVHAAVRALMMVERYYTEAPAYV